jgi:lysophospholipase L1-like esterase
MKQPKRLAIYLIIAIAVFLYLNRSYAYIYNHIDNMNLTSPGTQQSYSFKNPSLQADMIKYVALGDSLTAGVGSNDYQKTFPYLLAMKLMEKNDVTLTNLGGPGAKTKDVITDQIDKAAALNPDYLTLLIGTNDIHGLVSAKEFQTNFQTIIDQLTAKTKAKIIVINIPYLGAGNLILPPYDSYFDNKTKQFNQIIKKIADQKSLCYIDLYGQSKKSFAQNQKLYYSSDLFHPSAQGYQLWSEIIYANSSCFSN